MFKYILSVALAALIYFTYSNMPVKHGPGVTASSKPTINLLKWQKPFTYKGANIIPKKEITATVRVIAKERYYYGSYKDFSQVDVLVGWDKMSDETYLDKMHPVVEDRFYSIDLAVPPMKVTEIYAYSDFWHLIPANQQVADKILNLRKGHIITVKALLVHIEQTDGINWKTETDYSPQNRKATYTLWVEDIQY